MNQMPVSRRRLLAGLLSPLVAGLPACGGSGGEAATGDPPRFTADGLQGRVVRRLRPSPAGLLAATDDGAYRRAAQGWVSAGLAGWWVQDISAISPLVWLASVYHAQLPARDWQLMLTHDGGLGWTPLAHDFGGSAGPEGIQVLVNDAQAHRLLAAGADVLAESIDLGLSWRKLAGDWHRFAQPKDSLAFDPVRGDVWYGGQDAIEGMALFRRREGSGQFDTYPGLLPSPGTTKGIRFAMGEPDRLLVSGEGGIVQTLDNGAHWQTLLQVGHRFYFDVLQDVQRPRRWVTASWQKNYELPQPLRVEVSNDDGRSWARFQHPDSTLFGGAWSMALTLEEGRSVYSFGLYKGGVMRLELA